MNRTLLASLAVLSLVGGCSKEAPPAPGPQTQVATADQPTADLKHLTIEVLGMS